MLDKIHTLNQKDAARDRFQRTDKSDHGTRANERNEDESRSWGAERAINHINTTDIKLANVAIFEALNPESDPISPNNISESIHVEVVYANTEPTPVDVRRDLNNSEYFAETLDEGSHWTENPEFISELNNNKR